LPTDLFTLMIIINNNLVMDFISYILWHNSGAHNSGDWSKQSGCSCVPDESDHAVSSLQNQMCTWGDTL